MVEREFPVLILVQLCRACENDFPDLSLIFEVFVDLDVGIALVGIEPIITELIIYWYFLSHFLPPNGKLCAFISAGS